MLCCLDPPPPVALPVALLPREDEEREPSTLFRSLSLSFCIVPAEAAGGNARVEEEEVDADVDVEDEGGVSLFSARAIFSNIRLSSRS